MRQKTTARKPARRASTTTKKRSRSTSELEIEPLTRLTPDSQSSSSTRDYGGIPLLLRAPEVAYALGVSRALAYRWMAAGVLPVVRRGRSIRVPREALIKWIAANTKAAEDLG